MHIVITKWIVLGPLGDVIQNKVGCANIWGRSICIKQQQNSCFATHIIEQLWLVPFANKLMLSIRKIEQLWLIPFPNTPGLIHWKVNLSLQNCTVDGEFIFYMVQSTCFEILIVVIFVVTIVFLSFEIDWWDNLGWILTCVNLRITAAIAANHRTTTMIKNTHTQTQILSIRA